MAEQNPVRHLTLLRHAKAEQDGPSDRERELAPTGRRQCHQVADHLRASGRLPQLVLCSSSTRTQQTWELVAQALPEATPELRVLDGLYLGDVSDILDAVAGVGTEVTEVLVVGHEPGISETAYHLASDGSSAAAIALVRVGVPTASLSLLDVSQPWDHLARSGSTLEDVLVSPHS